MNERGYPVTVAVRRSNGAVEQVRVGTAYRTAEGFSLRMEELTISATAERASAPSPQPSPSQPPPARKNNGPAASTGGGGGGLVFPPYGRSKGAPIAGASLGDLEFYANGCRRSLNDPAKARWHDKERELLAAIEAEIARQQGGGGGGGQDGGYEAGPVGDDEDVPF